MGRRKVCPNRKYDIYPEVATIRKKSQLYKIKSDRRQKERLRRKVYPGISLIWYDAMNPSCCRLLNLHAMWWLIRLSNPPIILTKSYIPNARLGVISNPSYQCNMKGMNIPFDKLVKVQNTSIERIVSPWSIYINKNESWIPIPHHKYNIRTHEKLYADASYINYPMPSLTPDSEAISPLGQDLRKANCKIVERKYPYIVPTTPNGIIPPGYEWLASYRKCKLFKYEQVYAQDIIKNITTFNIIRHQNLLGDPFNIARDNDVFRIGIVQQTEALKINNEGQQFTLKHIASDVTSSNVIAAFPHKLLDNKVIRNWRKQNQVPVHMMKNAELQLEDRIDYSVFQFYDDTFLAPLH